MQREDDKYVMVDESDTEKDKVRQRVPRTPPPSPQKLLTFKHSTEADWKKKYDEMAEGYTRRGTKRKGYYPNGSYSK